MNESAPLVSVVVITYNSSDMIVETLDSVKEQTYRNIELIVSDDCSPDNTVSVVRNWLKENSGCFVRTKLVESPINTGVAPNINRGCKEAKGEWLKLLSGDDRLLKNAIEDYVQFVLDNSQCNICFGKFHFWGEDIDYVERSTRFYEKNFYPYIRSEYKVQWKRIQETLFVPGPGLFYKTSLWKKVGGFDERFPFADEYPFTYKVLECGERIYFLDKEVYAYQIRKGSLCREEIGLNRRVFNDQYRFIKTEYFGKAMRNGFIFVALHVLIHYYRVHLRYANVPSVIQKLSIILYLFSPYSYFSKIKMLYKRYVS